VRRNDSLCWIAFEEYFFFEKQSLYHSARRPSPLSNGTGLPRNAADGLFTKPLIFFPVFLGVFMDRFNVLIVEDNLTFRQALAEVLKSQFPYMVMEEAGSGPEALEKIDAFSPNLIFMDIKLPGENGLEVTRRIKDRHPEMIVAILTSYDLPEYRDVAFRYGANHFIVKGSSTFEEISSLIENVAADRRPDSPSAS
jgi:CheY-like chemotaxis protein